MPVLDVELIEESRTRYLTYALSVVNSRALPDIRDGLKPVQRRILYAMAKNLHLLPDKNYRKSAAVVGEVLARYHPHGDAACYEAMVRMAQDFNFRYTLVDGQGNFGSLDGDSAAAYRYTEAKLTALAIEVIGDIGQETVAERDNFDQTQLEPVVLPSRVPQLLINGTTGIAVGMATSIPPHNLVEVVKGLQLLIKDPKATEKKLLKIIKGPDFPTGCSIVTSGEDLNQIYKTGSGSVKMRGDYTVEKAARGKEKIVINSIPYALNKSSLMEKIADLILSRKIPQLNDVRDESTDVVRIVLEPVAGANPEKVMSYLYKNTPLESNFSFNLTAIAPTDNVYAGRPERMSLKAMLSYFLDFREEVTTNKLQFEKSKLEERAHLLDGLISIFDKLDEIIKIVRKSDGRSDAAAKLQKRFKISEQQSFFIVDMRIYQLSKTNIDEIKAELAEKKKRIKEINKLLKNRSALMGEISADLERISKEFGDKRRSKIISDLEEVEFDEDDYLEHEDVYVLITKDGWIKRIRSNNDPETSRIREGDSLFYTGLTSTKNHLAMFSNKGNMFVSRVHEIPSTSGYGDPVQKLYKFQDGEKITAAFVFSEEEQEKEIFMFSSRGLGLRLSGDTLCETKRSGKKLMKLKAGDELAGAEFVSGKTIVCLSENCYGVSFSIEDVPQLSGAGKGVILQKMPDDDKLLLATSVAKNDKLNIGLGKGKSRTVSVSEFKKAVRAKRGNKVITRGGPAISAHKE